MDKCEKPNANDNQESTPSSDEDSEAVEEAVGVEHCDAVSSVSDIPLSESNSSKSSLTEISAETPGHKKADSVGSQETGTSRRENVSSGTPKRKSTPRDMSERERSLRNRSAKVERVCSNAAHSSSSMGSSQSKNHLHQHQRHDLEARNRPREKSQNASRNQNVSNFERKADAGTMEAGAANSGSENIAIDEDQLGEVGNDTSSLSESVSHLSNLANEMLGGKVINSPLVPIVHNWQATKATVKERLGFMFCNELMADVHFVVGKNGPRQRIPAHKFVLSIGSAVFDAMFNGGMATADAEIELPDVEPAAFLCLLRFFYSDEVKIGPDTVMASLYAAKKYAVPALERGCVEYLKKHLSSDNAFMLLMQARLFDEPQLAAMCLEMIDKTTSEALVADGFTDIDLETLCIVLERDTLGIKECKLFAAIARWAEAECGRQGIPVTPENQRQVLGRALYLIRFPLMTVEEFAVGAAQSGILTDREVVELFLYFTVTPKTRINFSDVLRCCLTGKEQVVSRFCEIENRWGYSGTSDRIRSVLEIFIRFFFNCLYLIGEYIYMLSC